MVKYICLAPSKEQFNVKGKSLGMSSERALYYSNDIGKHRIYRNSYPLEPYMFNNKNINEKLELLYFNTSIEAQRLCDEINSVYGDDFMVKEVNVDGA
jgi:hypothetical protein